MEILSEKDWLARAQQHRARLEPVVTRHLARQDRSIKHPVYDFFFEYYRFAPAKILAWHPGFGSGLAGESAREFLRYEFYSERDGGVALDAAKFPAQRKESLAWITTLLEKTSDRPARFACFGLHEWAMVYRAENVRHSLPLRLEPDALAAFVESQKICCTHHDAFRFFTPAARPLNTVQPERPRIHELEQPGCVHANMDLYKWAFKFHPWIGGDLLGDCFLTGLAARELDMRASPYDCTVLGFEPIPIETPEGRRTYAIEQRAIAEHAAPLRARLLAVYRALSDAVGATRTTS